MLLVADTHFDDSPDNEYRWGVFPKIQEWVRAQKKTQPVVGFLGDLTDKKDRHTGELVNRMLEEMESLTAAGAIIRALKGNHDDPVNGVPYWTLLSRLDNVSFLTRPFLDNGGQLWLPFTRDPTEWDFSKWSKAKVIFMHDTVVGTMVKGRALGNQKLPPLPTHIPIYSGDIHDPQTIGNFTYVGAPHPVRFGDDHECRMLEIDDHTYEITRAIPTYAKRKSVITVRSLDDLVKHNLSPGDQIRVRMHVQASRVEQWSEDERELLEWAAKAGVYIASVEAMFETGKRSEADTSAELPNDPDAVYDEFCQSEGLTGDIYNAGRELMKGA